MAQIKLVVFVSFILIGGAEHAFGKVYERCELARELRDVHKAPKNQLATWVCIAAQESSYNTKLISKLLPNGSRDHGLYQINDKYWCSPPGTGKGCGLPCYKLEDDNIADDYKCIQTIFKETAKLSGNGFDYWSVYERFCKGNKSDEYIKDCF